MDRPLATRIGSNIATIRRTKQQTQAIVAEKTGMDPISLSRIERGAALPGLTTLDKLADALDVPLVQLLDGVSSKLPALADSIARELEPLSEADQLFLLGQLQGWAQKLKESHKR